MSGARLVRRGKQCLWSVIVSLPGGRRRYIATGTADERRAKRVLARIVEEMGQGIDYAENPTIAEWLGRWMRECVEPNRAPKTIAAWRYAVEHIIPRIGKRRLRDLKREDVQAMDADLLRRGGRAGRPLDPRTVRGIHAALSASIAEAVRRDMLLRNVSSLQPSPRVPHREAEYLSAEGARSLLAAGAGTPWVAAATLAVHTGMRVAEIVGLHWADIDLETATVQVRRQRSWVPGAGAQDRELKTAKGRRALPLAPAAVGLLRSMRAEVAAACATMGWPMPEHVFAHRRGGEWRGFAPLTASRGIKALYVRAGLPVPLRPVHALRHTLATLMGSEPVRIRQEQLGHSHPSVTEAVYTHVPSAEHRAAVERAADRIQPTREDESGAQPG